MSVDPSKRVPVPNNGPSSFDLGEALGGLLGDIIGGIGAAIAGVFDPNGLFGAVGDAMEPIRDAQLDLTHRTDLLEGVQGFAHAYMGANINAEWNLGDNWRTLPFDRQLGPSVGATVQPNGRIRLESEGLWVVFAKVHARATAWGGSNDVTLRVRIYAPDGSIHSDSYTRGASARYTGIIHINEKGPVSLVTTVPVVVPEPGHWVRVDAWTDAWRWWDGGTRLSSLSVLKQSSEVEHFGEETVPDESEGGA